MELSSLCNCITVGALSVQETWAEVCGPASQQIWHWPTVLSWDLPVKFLLHVALAPCACLSVELILLSLLLLLSETAISTKTLLSQSVILITRYKSGAILFWGRCQLIFDKIFPKNATFKLSLMSNDEPKNFIHFYILHIKNVWFLLKLEMALVTTIKIKFALVCVSGWVRQSKKLCWHNIWMVPIPVH